MRIVTRLILVLLSLVSAGISVHGAQVKPRQGKWEVLFDGKAVDKWRGYKTNSFPQESWKVEDGALKTIRGGHGPDIVTKEKYDNFELQLEWKVTPGANSGIMYRVSEDFDAPYETGPEMQVLDDDKHADGRDPKTSAGSLYALIAPKNKQLKPVGDWNKVRLVVQGNHAEHWINGVKVIEYELGSNELNQLIARSKFKDMPRFTKEKAGYIDLQHHGDEVWYRKIRVRRLSESGRVSQAAFRVPRVRV
jgi:Domain of Unknown Function (DUF1080)